MHEFSICRTIIESVLDELKKIELGASPPTTLRVAMRAGRLTKVRIVAGEYHQLAPDNLRSTYEVLSKDTPAEGSCLEIELKPIVCQCKQCGWQGEIRDFMYSCGACGAGEIELIGGKELYLDKLEIEQDDDSQH